MGDFEELFRVNQPDPLRSQGLFLVGLSGPGFLETGAGDFLGLECQELQALAALLLPARPIFHLGGGLAPLAVNLLVGAAPGKEVAGPIEDVDMPLRFQKMLVLVLAVYVHKPPRDLFQHVQSYGIAVEIGARFSGPVHEAPDHQSFVLFKLEPAQDLFDFARGEIEEGLDGSLFGPGADHFDRSLASEDQADGIHQDGFSRPRFSGQGVQTRAEFNLQLVDDREIFDG